MAVLKNSNCKIGKMAFEKDNKKVHLVAQELKLTRVLAGNNKSARDKALNNLKKWFAKRAQTMPFTEDDFQRIWKGLFYAMWMSDKPLVQEECAENIANLVHFPTVDSSLLFFKAGLIILNNEWTGIDQLRLDKFLMLMRRLLRQAFFVLKKHSFAHKDIEKFNNVLSSTILMPLSTPALGLLMHFIEIFMEELAKVSEGRIHSEKVCVFLRPFIEKLVTTNDGRLIEHLRKFIFTYLIRQSDLGFEYQAKYEAWKQQGFPGSIDSMQKIPLGDEDMVSQDEEGEAEDRNKPLDPRAGRVDVEIPQLKFSAKTIASNLMQHKYDKNSTTKARNTITVLSEQFNKLAKGVYPLGVKKLLDAKIDQYDMSVRKATVRLIKFEQKLMGKDRKRKREKTAKDQEDEIVVKKCRKEIQGLKNKDQMDEYLLDKSSKDSDNQTANKNINKSNHGVARRKTKTKTDFEKLSLDEDFEIKIKDTSKILKMKEKAKKFSDKQTQNRKNNRQSIVDNIECIFERNSGTWVVFDVTDCDNSEKIPTLQQSSTARLKKVDKVVEVPSLQSKKLNGNVSDKSLVPLLEKRTLRSKNKNAALVTSSAESETQLADEEPTIDGVEIHSEIKRQIFSYLFDTIKSKSSLLELSPETSPTQKTRSFPESEWDKPLQEGEYEILIPSKKHMRKKKNGHKTPQELENEHKTMLNTTMNSISRSSRTESQTSPVTPGGSSSKKVKFNTRLNTSQEVYEHHAQVKSSPGIPYDASKKPTKPLLKGPANMSPINPFYRRKLNL